MELSQIAESRSGLPRFISFGEALTDLIRTGPDTWRSVCGGAPWNVALAMARLGIPSAFAGGISDSPFGKEILRISTASGLDTRFIQTYQRAPLLAIVHEQHPPAYFFIGDDSADLHFDPDTLPEDWSGAVELAHFGCLGLVREPLAGRLVRLAETLKRRGTYISYDPNFRNLMTEGYRPTLERMCRIADVIKVSDEDLNGLFPGSDQAAAIDQIKRWAPDVWLLYTLGANGARLLRGDECWEQSSPKIKLVDSVGAGDAAMAGLLASLMMQPKAVASRHLQWAVAAGALACQVAGSNPPEPSALLAMVDALHGAERVVRGRDAPDA